MSNTKIFMLIICMLVVVLLSNNTAFSQHEAKITLTLEHAIQTARENNKHIAKAELKKDIATQEVDIARDRQLPDLDFHTSYARITNLTEFHNGYSNKEVIKAIPDMYDATLSAKVPLYAGGRIKTAIEKSNKEKELSTLQVEKTTNDIEMDVIGTYLGIYKLMSVQQVINEQIKEEQKRLREVQALKRNGAVTKNEILRAELQLNNMQLSLITNQKNITVATHDLQTILNLSEEMTLELDTTNLLQMPALEDAYEAYLQKAYQKEDMRIALKHQEIALAERKEVKGGFYPTVGLFGSYAYKYPDYMLFPPTPYLYSLGMIGVDVNFSISNLYKNKKKMTVANKHVAESQLETSILKDEITDKVFKEYQQLKEIKERIPVTEKAIQQAEENYRIIKVKYLNQLALITDIVDADNALLQARFNNVSEKIDAQMKFYQLLYASGMLDQNKLN
ncbi:TolC family protein [Danxiaibacter flavus]|uniref:TolC family protein n=1 Tax=Danxiaibacter flavus TaxID=3049108 RepID=A0ABV3ZCI1_9BACT|nr:TolC family protein [Chitinophagaceae bacterium DXS]